jgi:hypothetical protein
MMTKNKKIWLGAGGGVALLAAAAALAASGHDGHRGGGPADVNRDGQVTSAEIDQTARQAFTAYDVNGDGRLVGAELALMHEGREGRGRRHGGRAGPAPEAAPAQQGAPAAAAPGQAAPAQAAPAVPAQPQLRNDFDGDGAVSLAEFRRGLATRYILLDTNRDGTVLQEEFAAAPRGGRGGHGR